MGTPGYAGRILYIDLDKQDANCKSLDENWIQEYLGGWGINYRIAHDEIVEGLDPLSPENPIILGVGPFAGTLYPGSSKLLATSKMPMTASKDGKHFVATSTGGSNRFTLMIKSAGYDHVVLRGIAKKPIYIKIDDDKIEFCDAQDLWGKKDVYQTADFLNKNYPEFGVATIGKAGENKVRFAMAYVDRHWHLGKSGFGANMGSKNVKAIIVRGTGGVNVADPSRFMAAIDALRVEIMANRTVKRIQKMGFHALWKPIWVHNFYQSENWTKEEWSKYYGVEIAQNLVQANKACSTCPIGCKTVCVLQNEDCKEQELLTMHFSSIAPIGDRFLLEDVSDSFKFGALCNTYGMDVLNATSMVDWVTRLYEDKVIDREQTDGIELRRNMDTYLLLLNKMANRSGAIGGAMADGWFALSEFVGRDAVKDYIYGNQIAKGQECIYPARASKLDPMRITMLMTNPRGGGSPHGHSATVVPLRPLEDIKADAANTGISMEELEEIFSENDFDHACLTRHIEDAYAVYNALGICSTFATFGFVNVKVLAEAYSALTGIETKPEQLKKCGERITNLYKILNVREGFGKENDLAPEAVFVPIQTPEGIQELQDYYRTKSYSMEDCKRLLEAYYECRGWDVETGIPSKEKLEELKLTEFLETSRR